MSPETTPDEPANDGNPEGAPAPEPPAPESRAPAAASPRVRSGRVVLALILVGAAGFLLFRAAERNRQPDVFVIGDTVTRAWARQLQANGGTGLALEWPESDAPTTRHTFYNLSLWLGAVRPKAIVWNNGLEDLRRVQRGRFTTMVVPMRTYERNLKAIAEELLLMDTRVVFVTTTPVRDELADDQHNADVVRYNAIARRTLEPLGVEIVDLHGFVVESGIRDVGDGVHFSEADSLKMGLFVAEQLGR